MLAAARRLAFVWAVAGWSASARAENLREAWQMALAANPALQAEALYANAAALNLSAARRDRLPKARTFAIDAQLNRSPMLNVSQFGTPGGVGAALPFFAGQNQNNFPLSLTAISQPLYSGGRMRGAVDAADADFRAQRAEQARAALDLKLIVADAYIGVLRAQQDLKVADSDVRRLSSFHDDVINRQRVGMATRNEGLSAEVSLANARLRVIEARTTLDTAWATYNRYLMRPLDVVVPLAEISLPSGRANVGALTERALRGRPELSRLSQAELARLTGQALGQRPELARLAHQARSLGAQARVARATSRPQVSVNGAYLFLGNNALANQNFWLAAATADWTLFDGGASRRRGQAFEEQQRAALRQQADQAAAIALEVRTRWLSYEEARQRIAVSRVAVAQAEENVNVVRDRYRQQLSTYTEVLDAERQRVQAQVDFATATYDAALAFFRLRRAVGDL